MDLEISSIISSMSDKMNESIKDSIGEPANGILEVLQGRQGDLNDLVQALKTGDLTEEDFQEELKREKIVLETELLAKEIAAKSAVQKAINAAMDTLTGIVKSAL